MPRRTETSTFARRKGKFRPARRLPRCGRPDSARAAEIRARREAAFFSPETAAKFAERYPAFRKEIAGFLVAARGNAEELTAFLDRAFPLERKVELLLQLREKDFADCPASVLEDALVCALPFRSRYPEEVYRRFILSPRVEQEFLFGCRAQLTALFSPERRAAFQKEPEKIGAFLARTVQVRDDLDYGALAANPVGLLQMKTGSARSLRVLYVSLCRAIGVPARLNPMTGRAEFLRENVWRNPDGAADSSERGRSAAVRARFYGCLPAGRFVSYAALPRLAFGAAGGSAAGTGLLPDSAGQPAD